MGKVEAIRAEAGEWVMPPSTQATYWGIFEANVGPLFASLGCSFMRLQRNGQLAGINLSLSLHLERVRDKKQNKTERNEAQQQLK